MSEKLTKKKKKREETGLSLRFQVTKYLQLAVGELNSQGFLLVSFSFFSFLQK